MHPRIARRREAIRQTDEIVADMVEAKEEERRRWAASHEPSSGRIMLAVWIAAAVIITSWAVVMAILLAS